MSKDTQGKIAGLGLTPLEQTYLESCMGDDDVSAHKTGHSLVRKLATALVAEEPANRPGIPDSSPAGEAGK